LRHIEDIEARALAEKTDGHRQALARRVEMGRDLGAVAEGTGRGDDRSDGKRDAGQVLQELADLTLFPGELVGVGEVLVLATAAAAEERTGGGHAGR
jgi:hypothetical protein